jgi:two-component system LytT family response regulator
MIKIMIVDDEPSAGNILRLLIERYVTSEKEILVCQHPEEALKLIEVYKPTLLMLDIEMPKMNGFDLLNQLGYWNFDVIFTTAYDKYAIKAIRFSAMDYLLKPIDVVDLQNAINRHVVKSLQADGQQKQLLNNLIGNLKKNDNNQFKLALSTLEGVFFFYPSQIVRLEGESNYTRFYFTDQRPLVISHTLKDYEDILAEHDFIRVHKSHLVNKTFIKHFDKEGYLRLTDGSQISVSRRRREEVLKGLSEK